MYIDVYFTGALPLDRDDVEDEFASLDEFEVVGAGGGDSGSNIDLEVDSSVSRDDALNLIAQVLQRLNIAAISHLKISDTGERIEVVDLLP
jgi:hypothetical protein